MSFQLETKMSYNATHQMGSKSDCDYYLKQKQLQEHKVDRNSTVLYPFQPFKWTKVYTMDRYTALTGMGELIDQAEKTIQFSMYTKRNDQTKEVTLIVIEFFQMDHMTTNTVIFDLLNRPEQGTYIYAMMQILLLNIFQTGKKCFIWNENQQRDLKAFVSHKFLSFYILKSMEMIQLQKIFKYWYNTTFPHHKDYCAAKDYIDDSICCTCFHRPIKDMNDEWSLPRALYFTFNEFIYTTDEELVCIPQDIQYSTICCMILTKLLVTIEMKWTQEHLSQFKKTHQYCLRFA